MAIEVFNRYEKKYMLNKQQYEQLTERILAHMIPDAYNQDKAFYQICNIYYDTPDDRLIRASIEKPVYKEKLRVRSYGKPGMQERVFVEIKKKYRGIVNKRRTAMRLCDAYAYLNEDEKNQDAGGENAAALSDNIRVNKQVLAEIDYFKEFYQLVPKVYLSYDRRAYFEKDDGDFRITFDTNITTRRTDLRLEHGSYGEQLLPQDTYLMEIKINRAVPLWFTKIISELNIYPVSFSKYGTEYKKYVLENRKGDLLCLNPFLQVQQQTMPSALAPLC